MECRATKQSPNDKRQAINVIITICRLEIASAPPFHKALRSLAMTGMETRLMKTITQYGDGGPQ